MSTRVIYNLAKEKDVNIVNKTDALIKIAKGKSMTINGTSNIQFKVIKTRYIRSGTGWFDTHHPDDYIIVNVLDKDGIMGYGPNVVIATFTDYDVESAEYSGWWFEPDGRVTVKGFDVLKEIPPGVYLDIYAIKGNKDESGFQEENFRFNLYWGEK